MHFSKLMAKCPEDSADLQYVQCKVPYFISYPTMVKK